jgi:RimJ/RimL family protein N-acetyltransferase
MHPGTTWLDPPRIEAGRVVLRENRADDLTRILQACSDPVTQRWLPELPSPNTLVDAAWYLDSRAEQHATGLGLYWAVADVDDDRLLAQVALTGLRAGTGRSAEIGYWTHPDARGTGVMPTAVRLVARHALLPAAEGGLGLERVQLRVADGNVASIRVAVKAGFTACGVDRAGERLRDGSVVDFHRFDLLATEMERAWAHRAAMS